MCFIFYCHQVSIEFNINVLQNVQGIGLWVRVMGQDQLLVLGLGRGYAIGLPSYLYKSSHHTTIRKFSVDGNVKTVLSACIKMEKCQIYIQALYACVTVYIILLNAKILQTILDSPVPQMAMKLLYKIALKKN